MTKYLVAIYRSDDYDASVVEEDTMSLEIDNLVSRD